MEPEPKFEAPASPSKSFWLQLQSSQIAWALVPGSTALAIEVKNATGRKLWNDHSLNFIRLLI